MWIYSQIISRAWNIYNSAWCSMIKFRAHNASVSEQLIYSPPESMHRWCFCKKKKKKKGGLLYVSRCSTNMAVSLSSRSVTNMAIVTSCENDLLFPWLWPWKWYQTGAKKERNSYLKEPYVTSCFFLFFFKSIVRLHLNRRKFNLLE